MVGMNAVGFRGHKPSGFPQSGTTTGNAGSSGSNPAYISWNDSGSSDQTSFSNNFQYDTQSDPSSDGSDSSQGSGKGHGRDKTCQSIPPGLAKKKSSDLPDGNPWKAALAQQEQSSSSSGSGQSTSQPPANDVTDPSQTSSYDTTGTTDSSMPVQLLEGLVELLNNLLTLSTSQSQPGNSGSPA